MTKDVIYHYTTHEVAKKILSSNKIRLNPLTHVNDPREYSDWSLVGDNPAGHDHETHMSIQSEIQQLRKYCKIACFSTDVPNMNKPINLPHDVLGKGLANPVLWHYYGEKHKGVCFGFDREKLSQKLNAHYSAMLPRAKLVDYSDNCVAPDLFVTPYRFDYVEACEGMESYGRVFVERNLDALFFSKHKSWEHENEFRLFVYNDKDSNFIELDVSDCIHSLTFSMPDKAALDEVRMILRKRRQPLGAMDKILFRNDRIIKDFGSDFY